MQNLKHSRGRLWLAEGPTSSKTRSGSKPEPKQVMFWRLCATWFYSSFRLEVTRLNNSSPKMDRKSTVWSSLKRTIWKISLKFSKRRSNLTFSSLISCRSSLSMIGSDPWGWTIDCGSPKSITWAICSSTSGRSWSISSSRSTLNVSARRPIRARSTPSSLPTDKTTATRMKWTPRTSNGSFSTNIWFTSTQESVSWGKSTDWTATLRLFWTES